MTIDFFSWEFRIARVAILHNGTHVVYIIIYYTTPSERGVREHWKDINQAFMALD